MRNRWPLMRWNRGRFTTRRAASLPPALLARVGAMRIAIGAAVIEVPRLIIPQWTNDVGRWVVVEREDE